MVHQSHSSLVCFIRSLCVNKLRSQKMNFLKFLSVVLIFVTTETVTSSNTTQSRIKRNNNQICGISSQATSLIIGGSDFQRGTWPWMVAIMKKTSSKPQFFCGGILISNTKLLTGKRWQEYEE